MKHKILFMSIAIAIIAIVLSLFHKSHTSPGGSPGNYTGGPGDGNCAASGCHTGTTPISNSPNVTLTTNIPSSGWIEGQTYSFTLNLSSTGTTKSGFQIGAFNGSNNGSFIANSQVQVQSSGKRATHKLSSTSGTNGRSWTFDWTAPASTSLDSINFYYAVNASNSDGDEAGDIIHLGHTSFLRNLTDIQEEYMFNALQIYPNPVQAGSNIYISSKALLQAEAYVYDMKGTLILSKSINLQNNKETLNTNQLSKGIYILKIQSQNKIQERQILVY